jgi:magnesium chelatase accessory protein
MAAAIGALLRKLDLSPVLAVGHSAGAAIVTRMVLDHVIAPRTIVSINGAFVGFRGPATQFFSPIAKLLMLNPIVPHAFAWRAGDPAVAERLLRDTGSSIDARGMALYRRLFANSRHVAGALGMMAAWDLDPLRRDMRRLEAPLILAAGERDGMVPPAQADEVRRLVPMASVVRLPNLGHLAHEEAPAILADLIVRAARDGGVSPDGPVRKACDKKSPIRRSRSSNERKRKRDLRRTWTVKLAVNSKETSA